MPFAENSMITGVTTAAQSATLPAVININCGFLPTKVRLTNETQYGQTGTGNLNIQTVEWDSSISTNTKLMYINAAGTALLPGILTSNGISTYNGQSSVLLSASVTGTTITKANPAVCTATAHGFNTGDVVVLSQFTTGMQQLAGIPFTVTRTGANTFTIPLNTNTANFTAATAFIARKVVIGPLFQPQRINITAITAANPMVVSTAQAHGLTVGQQVRLRVGSTFGMTQANNLQGVITAVGSTTTFTIGGIDSSAFTAFAWPTNSPLAVTPPQVIPIGSGPAATTVGGVTYYQDLLDDQTVNQQFQGFTIGTSILLTSTNAVIGSTASDIYSWTAWRGDV